MDLGLTWVGIIYAHAFHIYRCCVLSLTVERSAARRAVSESWWLLVALQMEFDKKFWDEKAIFSFTCEKHQLCLQRQDSNMKKAIVVHF